MPKCEISSSVIKGEETIKQGIILWKRVIFRGHGEISSGKVKHKTKLKLTFVAVLFPLKIRLVKRFTYDNHTYSPLPIPAQSLCAVMSHIGHWPQVFFSVFSEKCPSKTDKDCIGLRLLLMF